MPNSLFFDSSALFAAAYSSTGAARELLRWSIQGKVRILISQDVLEETTRNLERKAPDKVEAYQELLLLLEPGIVPSPTPQDVWAAEEYVEQKDAPIAAAAKNAQTDFLVTLDKKHILGKPELAKYIETKIVTPKEAIAQLRKTD